MSSPFVAEIRILACNFAPRGWAQCNGQILPISQNTALFSLVGTFYGGNGQSTFALPNLQGSVPIGQGQGPGLSDRFIGETSGTTTVTLIQTEIPVHSHSINASQADGGEREPTAQKFATGVGISTYQAKGAIAQPNPAFVQNSVVGGSQPHNNLMPFLTLNFCIAMQGVFPARN